MAAQSYIIMVYIPLNFKGTEMKTLISVLMFAVVLFSGVVAAEENQSGWVPVNSLKDGQFIGMTNTGSHGGKLTLLCDVQTRKLRMEYNGGGNRYDLFVFYTGANPNMASQDLDGKFIVGLNNTTQGQVYYNVLKAKQTFVIARFPVGSGAKYLKAAATGDMNMPEIQQEGDEQFFAGSDMRFMLHKLSSSCPINQNKDQAIF